MCRVDGRREGWWKGEKRGMVGGREVRGGGRERGRDGRRRERREGWWEGEREKGIMGGEKK